MSMGRLSEQKGYKHLIKAFAIVASKIDHVHLVIMGNGDKREKLEKKQLCLVGRKAVIVRMRSYGIVKAVNILKKAVV